MQLSNSNILDIQTGSKSGRNHKIVIISTDKNQMDVGKDGSLFAICMLNVNKT